MADPHDQNLPPDETPIPGPTDGEGPVGREEDEPIATPRRAASAQFIVDTQVGADVALREAMDPANQSLAEALRLSYRVLQVVILVLVVLFIFSGWKSVREGETGVLTVWGRIAEVSGSRALTPGLKFSKWPYPAGEFILFAEENRAVEADRAFWPAYRRGQSFEEAVAASTINQRLKPGRDGSLVTRDRELAHAQISARYAIADPVRFVERVAEGDADRLVMLAIQRASVHQAATLSVEELTDQTGPLFTDQVERGAQATLDQIDCGIVVQSLSSPRAVPLFPIIKTMDDLSTATEQVNTGLEQARNIANETLTAIVGGEHAKDTAMARDGLKRYDELELLIDNYEEAIASGDAEAEAAGLAAINSVLGDAGTSGEVARIIFFAESYQSQIESTLGNEARRFASLLPTYRSQPDMVIRRLWYEAYKKVLNNPDAEIFWVPQTIASMTLHISGLDAIAQKRRTQSLKTREQDTLRQFANPLGVQVQRAGTMTESGKAGRQLDRSEEGGVKARERRLMMVKSAESTVPIVEAVGLTKVFKDFWMRTKARAVDDVDFVIHQGEIFGLLGPNGSGKSTIIKMILGLLHTTHGRLTVFGRTPADVSVKKHIGFLPEESYLYRFLNSRETLDYYGKLFGIDRKTRRRRTDELLDMIGLTQVAHRPIGEFSKGMTRRIGIAQALINDPQFLILDEPTSGLDPIGTRQVKDLLLALRERGKTILLSSHLLGDVEDVCDRMVMLYGGKVRAAGTVLELLSDTHRTIIETGQLRADTISRIEEVLQEAEGKGIDQVRAPRQRLEDLFMEIVEQAREEQVETSGAVHGGETAAFLRAEDAEGDHLIDTLVRDEPEAVRAIEVEDETPEAAASPGVLDELLHRETDTPKAVPRSVEKGPVPKKPTDVDSSVIDSLLDDDDT